MLRTVEPAADLADGGGDSGVVIIFSCCSGCYRTTRPFTTAEDVRLYNASRDDAFRELLYFLQLTATVNATVLFSSSFSSRSTLCSE